MRILIAGKQADTRRALTMLLETRPDPDVVVGEAANEGELVTQIETQRPDLVLLDEDLPGRPINELISTMGGLDFTPALIALSVQPETEPTALAAGADAFVYKGDPPKRLLIAIEAIRSRGDYEK